jgi:hypothetical protein
MRPHRLLSYALAPSFVGSAGVAGDAFVFGPPTGAKKVSASQLDLHPPTKYWR